MNTSRLLASAILAATALASTAAFAGDNDYPPVAQQPASTLTRAEVRAEYLQARREGTLINTDINYPVVAAGNSDKSRAEVKAELANAMRAGHSTRIDNSYPAELDAAS